MAYEPDWVERNGTWLLSVLGLLSSCGAGLLVYALKSRCTKIKGCGCECDRDVIALDADQVSIQP